MGTAEQPEQGLGYLPYVPAALSIRAAYVDATGPQEVVIDFAARPPDDTIAVAIRALTDVIGSTRPAVTVTEPGPGDRTREISVPPRPAPASGEPETVQLPRPFCPARLKVRDDHDHQCTQFAGHEPAEPDGREHRCRCGGLFATDVETGDVPGRKEQERDRARAVRR